MATGIDTDKISTLKIQLLDCVEAINKISEKLDNCKVSIGVALYGEGNQEIISKLNAISEQIPTAKSNMNAYITLLDKVVNNYEIQDTTVASKVTTNINNLEKLRRD